MRNYSTEIAIVALAAFALADETMTVEKTVTMGKALRHGKHGHDGRHGCHDEHRPRQSQGRDG